MAKNRSADIKQFNNYKSILTNSSNMPTNIDKFVDMKYNNKEKYSQLKREYVTIGKINRLSNNVERDKTTYYKFRNDKIEMSQHAIYDYHLRMYKKDGSSNYDYEKIKSIIKNPPNYIDTKTNRYVNYYDNIAIISEKNTREILSLWKGRLASKWKAI